MFWEGLGSNLRIDRSLTKHESHYLLSLALLTLLVIRRMSDNYIAYIILQCCETVPGKMVAVGLQCFCIPFRIPYATQTKKIACNTQIGQEWVILDRDGSGNLINRWKGSEEANHITIEGRLSRIDR
jgi:hypothetical protein